MLKARQTNHGVFGGGRAHTLAAAALGAWAALTVVAPASALAQVDTDARRFVSMRVEEVYTFTSTATPDRPGCPGLTIDARGRGQLRPVGEFTIVQSHCFDPATLNFTRGTFIKRIPETGERIEGTYSGRLVPTPTSDKDGLLQIDAALIFTRGTGKFKEVRGAASIGGLFNTRTGAAGVAIEGEIRFRKHSAS